MIKIAIVIGTRPEAIKLAPLVIALRREKWAQVKVVLTAQHRDLLDGVLQFFDVAAEIDLNLMQPDQTLAGLTAGILVAFDSVLLAEKPDLVILQGDTTTVMAVALTCFYHRVRVAHVEAGLRTGNMGNPFPEELNRVLTGKLVGLHFAPTRKAEDNLLREGVDGRSILVTGNTVIDALFLAVARKPELDMPLDSRRKLLLVTCHRRENFGEPLKQICSAINTLAQRNPDIQILFPVHPNPNVGGTVRKVLTAGNIVLCASLPYGQFVAAMMRSHLILTDSGGVQEEAPALGIPVLVLRTETERPEALQSGAVRLVGHSAPRIIEQAEILLNDEEAYAKMARPVFPYGDGKACERIVARIAKTFFVG